MFRSLTSGQPGFRSLWFPGLWLAAKLPLQSKLMALVALPLLAMLLALCLWVQQAWQARTEALAMQAATPLLDTLHALGRAVQHHRMALTTPELAPPGPAPSLPALRAALDKGLAEHPTWAPATSRRSVAGCLTKVASMTDTGDLAAFEAGHQACVDQLVRLAQEIAQDSGLSRAADRATQHSATALVRELGLLEEAADRLTLLHGRPTAGAYLMPEQLRSWVGPEGITVARWTQAQLFLQGGGSVGATTPASFDAARQQMLTFGGLLSQKLVLGELVPRAELADRANRVNAMRQSLSVLRSDLRQQLRQHTDNALSQARWRLMAVCAVALLLSIATLYLSGACVSSLVRQIDSVRHCLTRLTSGDLSARAHAHGRDELARLAEDVNRMAAALGSLVTRLHDETLRMGNSTDSLSDGTEQLATRSAEQVYALDESTRALGEVTTAVASSTALAAEVHLLSDLLCQRARESQTHVDCSVAALGRIEERALDMGNALSGIEAISMQTRLLSLNATIEAAHAGRTGRGFALVASEVRNLAERTSGVANEIKKMIDQIRSEIEAGSREAASVQTITREVNSHSETTARHMQALAAQSNQQSQALTQVRGSLDELSRIAEANLSMVQESVIQAHVIRDSAVELRQAADALSHPPASVAA